MVRLVPEAEIEGHLVIDEAVSAIEQLHRTLGKGKATTDVMKSILTPVSEPPEGTDDPVYHGLRTMGGAIAEDDVASVRISSDIIHWPHTENGRVREKIPAVDGEYTGFVLLFSTNTGEPLAILPDAVIQHLRVSASSAVASKYLAPENATTLGVLGTGWQARSHVPALDLIHDFESVSVYSPTTESRTAFAEEMNDQIDAAVEAVDDPRSVFENADIVQCTTNSTEPVFEMDWVESGTHVTIIRLAEAPAELFEHDRVEAFVTNWPPKVDRYQLIGNELKKEHVGEWTWDHYPIHTDKPIPKFSSFGSLGSTLDWRQVPSVAEIMAGDVLGRTDATDVTGCYTCAIGVDFTAVSALLYDIAVEKDLGVELDLELFTQRNHP